MEKKTRALFVRGIDPELIQAFKAWCVLRSISMKDKLQEMMRDIVRTTPTGRKTK